MKKLALLILLALGFSFTSYAASTTVNLTANVDSQVNVAVAEGLNNVSFGTINPEDTGLSQASVDLCITSTNIDNPMVNVTLQNYSSPNNRLELVHTNGTNVIPLDSMLWDKYNGGQYPMLNNNPQQLQANTSLASGQCTSATSTHKLFFSTQSGSLGGLATGTYSAQINIQVDGQ